MEQPETITLTAADTVRTRIDRLVLRYDAAAKKTSLTVLTGAPGQRQPHGTGDHPHRAGV